MSPQSIDREEEKKNTSPNCSDDHDDETSSAYDRIWEERASDASLNGWTDDTANVSEVEEIFDETEYESDGASDNDVNVDEPEDERNENAHRDWTPADHFNNIAPTKTLTWDEIYDDVEIDKWVDTTNESHWSSIYQRLWEQRLSGSFIASRLSGMVVTHEWPIEDELVGFRYGSTLLNERAIDDLANIEDRLAERINTRREIAVRAMINRRRKEKTVIVDTEEQLLDLLRILKSVDQTKASVVIDCEGLSKQPQRDGATIPERVRNIDVMEVFVPRVGNIYLVGVSFLKARTWTISLDSGFSLKEFLTSKDYKKIMWDVKADAHILDHLYGVRLDGIKDASLYEVAYRAEGEALPHHWNRLKVEHAMKMHLQASVDILEIGAIEQSKNDRHGLTGSVWAERPLNPILIAYAGDVRYMNMLYNRCSKYFEDQGKLDTTKRIDELTRKEIQAVCDPFYRWDSDSGSNGTPFDESFLRAIHFDNWCRRQQALGGELEKASANKKEKDRDKIVTE